MAKLNLGELLGGLQEAAMITQSIAEKQHINNLSKYFDPDGNPITVTFNIPSPDGKIKAMIVPLYILADHSSIGLSEMTIEFEVRLFAGHEEEPSKLKQGLLSIFQKKKAEGKNYNHNIQNIYVDSSVTDPNAGGKTKISIKFKSDEKPEAVSRLVDRLIQTLDDNTHSVVDSTETTEVTSE